MTQSVRQSELFASQDWHVLYRAFTQINFNASDPTSINQALRAYVQNTYAEDFSDWIESSEFVAIIDLLAWLAGTLAFKTDINARENWLETAEARESVLRLARFLSYTPRRNQAANGLLKLVTVKTDDNVFDAIGNDLSNVNINWNDANDPDWFEKMVLVLNNAFISTNPFGVPIQKGTLAGSKTQVYRFNSRFGDQNFSFQSIVSGTSLPFEFINMSYADTSGFTERNPDYNSAFHLAYRTDGNGNSSPNTGFFIPFRQGQLTQQTFYIDTPSENMVIDINVKNINETDVWVQTVNDAGEVTKNWTKVSSVFSENITYNTEPNTTRDIFSVITRDNDQISIRFGDGRFGSAPVGNLRVWYRTSAGYQYTIKSKDISDISKSITYVNRFGSTKTITMTFALQYNITNSAAPETIESIKLRAPQVYATQNRMVSGEDYNTFPLSSNLAAKIKAVSRIYSGQSRYIDLNDPTGNYQATRVFSDDGMFYKQSTPSFVEFPVADNRSPDDIISNYITPMLSNEKTRNYVLDFHTRAYLGQFVAVPTNLIWHEVGSANYASTGWFNETSPYLDVGTLVQFAYETTTKWVAIYSLTTPYTTQPSVGNKGPVALSENVPTGARVTAIIPTYSSTLPTTIKNLIKSRIQNRLSFTLWYDFTAHSTGYWSLRGASTLDAAPQTYGAAVRVCSVEYLSNTLWRISAKGMQYFFESLNNVKFFYSGKKVVNPSNQTLDKDTIRILSINPDINNGGAPFAQDFDLDIARRITYSDGFSDSNRIGVRFADVNEDGYPDYPDIYFDVVSPNRWSNYLFWVQNSDLSWSPYYKMVVYETSAIRSESTDAVGTIAFQILGTDDAETFWQKTSTGWSLVPRGYRFGRGRGPNVPVRYIASDGTLKTPVASKLNFLWKHFAPSDHRIDPSRSNIIDMFVLTNEYDYNVRNWILNGASASSLPTAPSELDIRQTFQSFESYKMFSDEIVWRPVSYKFLFGNGADAALQAQFKVVKLDSTSMSDGEIKSLLINTVNRYFDVQFWDFGETFYFTELAAYIHQQMAGVVASVVIVPIADGLAFGDGFEVSCLPDELFISTATVNNVVIINSNTPTNLRMI
jgi:hypothetical protein